MFQNNTMQICWPTLWIWQLEIIRDLILFVYSKFVMNKIGDNEIQQLD